VLAFFLFASLFLFFFTLTVKELPEPETVKAWMLGKGLGAASAVACFAAAALLWGPLAAVPWAFLGFRLPGWIGEIRRTRRKARLSAAARDFVTAAAGMYSAGLTTPEVLRRMSERMPEPLGSELAKMVARREMAGVSVAPMFGDLARRYDLPELEAVARIVSASERAGGPLAASKGLKRLGQALRQKERLAAERAKATMEPKIAAVVTLAILGAGLLLDGTVFRQYFAGPGRLVVAVASALVVGMVFIYRKVGRSEDLA